jgi:hypothetical protein
MTNTTAYVNYQNNVGNPNQASYVHILTVSSILTIFEATISYIAFDPTVVVGFMIPGEHEVNCTLLYNIVVNISNPINGYRTDYYTTFTIAGNIVTNSLNTVSMFTFITGFIISKYTDGGNFVLANTIGMNPSLGTYWALFTTNGTCVVTYGKYNYILVDFSLIPTSVGDIITSGISAGSNSVQILWPSYSNPNFLSFSGLFIFSFTSSLQPQVSLQNDDSFNISSTSNY